jgi:hypothetical protein
MRLRLNPACPADLVIQSIGRVRVLMQTQLPIEAMRAIETNRLTPRQLEKVLDVPQLRVPN